MAGKKIHETTDGDVETIGYLGSKGVDLNRLDHTDKTALHKATEEENVKIMQALLDSGANANRCNTIEGTPLHSAAARESIAVTKLLLQGGGDRWVLNSHGRTPFQWATAFGKNIEVMKALWVEGTDPSVGANSSEEEKKAIFLREDKYGDTPLLQHPKQASSNGCLLVVLEWTLSTKQGALLFTRPAKRDL